MRFGEYDVTDYSERKPKESPVSSLIVHDMYNDTTHDNDIGLMRLVRDIQFDGKYIVQSSRVNINNGTVCKIMLTKSYTSLNGKFHLFKIKIQVFLTQIIKFNMATIRS